MPAAITDLFTQATNGTRPNPAKLTSGKALGASSLSADNLTGWPTATAVHFSIYLVDTSKNKVSGSQSDWKGIVSGTTISNLTLKAGSDMNYPIGAIVEASPTAAWPNDMVAGLLSQHNQDGSHANVTATSVTTGNLSATGTIALPNNTITAANLATSAITLGYAQITANFSGSTGGTVSQVTGLSATVTIPAGGRRIKITAFADGLSTSGANTYVFLSIWDGTVGSGTQLSQIQLVSTTAGYNWPGTVMAVVSPAAGSKTYNVGLMTGSGATPTIQAATTYPAFILVEAI